MVRNVKTNGDSSSSCSPTEQPGKRREGGTGAGVPNQPDSTSPALYLSVRKLEKRQSVERPAEQEALG